MSFNSLEYLIFLPVVVFIYYLLPQGFRWILLLTASYFFYMSWKVEYALLIMTTTVVSYLAALEMAKKDSKQKRKKFLYLSLIVNLGILGVFKYFNFTIDSLQRLAAPLNLFTDIPELNVLLPVGISFYTFQSLSYVLEVYYGRQKAEKHLGIFALYVSFFPQLVAGPIERFNRLGPQFKIKHLWNYDNFSKGLRLILFGLFIKMSIADNLAVYVDAVYKEPSSYSSMNILTALFMYSFQIYADFYGYSLIAIGSARLLGISIMNNFSTPYLSRSIAEFWQRWHISLSTWFRDYVFLPVSYSSSRKFEKNRYGIFKTHFLIYLIAALVTFFLTGLWHGAGWHFVIWGMVHGIWLVFHRFWISHVRKKRKKSLLNQVGSVLITFILLTLTWVFFRSQSVQESFEIFGLICQNGSVESILNVKLVTWILLIFFILSDFALYKDRFDSWCEKRKWWVRWPVYAFLLYATIALSAVEQIPFIYFQF